MRGLALLALVPACKIADVHFLGTGGDDAAVIDGMADAPTSFDAPFSVTSHAYLVDTLAGVFVLARSPMGDLAFTGLDYQMPAMSAVIDRGHNRIFVLAATSPPVIKTLAIQPDGSLVAQPPDQTISQCTPQTLALSPNGAVLAVACSESTIVTYAVSPAGGFSPSITTTVFPGSPMKALAFSPNNACLFGASDVLLPSGNVFPFGVDPTSGSLAQLSNKPGPQLPAAVIVDPGSTVLYVAGQNQLYSFALNGCNLGPNTTVGANAMPQVMAIDLVGKNLFVAGTEIFSYSISAGNAQPNPGNPYLPNTTMMTGAVADVQKLYLTAAGFSGVMPATISTTGMVTANTQITSTAMAAHAKLLLLGP